jgi:uroporphyrinogen decarboxylase
MNELGFEPDFKRLKAVLMGGVADRVPNIELVIDREIKDGFLGRPTLNLADEIEFRYRAGYDYAWISVGMIDPAGTVNKDFVPDSDDQHFQGADKRVWANEHGGAISNFRDVEAFSWPDPQRLDYSTFTEANKYLRPGMKIIAILGKIFTAAWELVGLERFSELMYDQPELIDDLVERIGQIQIEVLKKIIAFDSVGAIWTPDDIAYHTGPMVNPAWLKSKVFPKYKIMGELCRNAGKPFIYHSDGDLTCMIDTIMDCGFNALHPIEPESMDIYELRKKVGNQLCLLGNIRVHTLSTGSPGQIRELVKDRVLKLGHKGAYCVGSSNSIPNYVPLEHYKVMLKASADYGRIM